VTADNVTITGTLTNSNLISGSGRIYAQLINNSTGEVRVAADESLAFSVADIHSNSGRTEPIALRRRHEQRHTERYVCGACQRRAGQ